ncbi:MAG: YdcF family protein [Bacteroidales bacterium]|nr:YdcF family protein [Bacteroidales bacterium]
MHWLKVLSSILLIGICLAVIAIITCNILVRKDSKGRIFQNVDDIPYRRVGLLLGTTPLNKRGGDNPYYTNRMKAAAELYHKGKITYVLVSGDNHKLGYNEPECMRRSLIALGVPDSVIFLDYAGFRTYDSMVRAKKVFGQDSVTVISQEWHNERAIYIARHHGIDAIALNAKDVSLKRNYVKNHAREALAKVKVVLDIIFHKKPKFLGEPVIIG